MKWTKRIIPVLVADPHVAAGLITERENGIDVLKHSGSGTMKKSFSVVSDSSEHELMDSMSISHSANKKHHF
jgi:hypothetical protein